MAKMVNKLTPVQQHILSLLNEWEDHHGLQKILDVIKMLLNIPFSTPLAKVEWYGYFTVSSGLLVEWFLYDAKSD